MNNINTIHTLCQVLFEIDYRATWMRPVIFTGEDVFFIKLIPQIVFEKYQ